MAIKTDNWSRFQFTEAVLAPSPVNQAATVETFGMWKPPSFIKERPPEDQIGRYKVLQGREGRPDLIAAELYGSSLLDWILISFNAASDVLNWPQPGAIIEYPVPSLVFSEID